MWACYADHMSIPRANPPLIALEMLGVPAQGQREAIDALLDGLPVNGWQKVTSALQVSDQQLAEAVSISVSTLTRRKREGRFTPEESERLLRLASLAAKASSVFTTPERIHLWFTTPNQQLGGDTPLNYAKTSIGADEVDRVLERILDGAPA